MYGPTTLIADVPGASIQIGEATRLNGAVIHAQANVSIGRRVLMAAQSTILDSNGHVVYPPESRGTERDVPRPVVVEDDVWIGMGAVVLPRSHIGEGSIIGANTVVSGRIPAHSILRAESSIAPLERRG